MPSLQGHITSVRGHEAEGRPQKCSTGSKCVLIEIASQIAARKMSDHPSPDAGGSCRAADGGLARRAGADKSAIVADLPKSKARCCRQRPISEDINKSLNAHRLFACDFKRLSSVFPRFAGTR